MVNIFDIAFNSFLYFRLGHHAIKKDTCLYCIADYDNFTKPNPKEVPYMELPVIESDRTMRVEAGSLSAGDESTRKRTVRRVCIMSDSHDRHEAINIPSCDLLIHAGDILMQSRFLSEEGALKKYKDFNRWLGQTPALSRIIIAGNHDKILEQMSKEEVGRLFSNATYLCNETTEIFGLRIFGVPFSTGISRNCAFQSTVFAGATADAVNTNSNGKVDFLITHGICKEIGQSIKPKVAHVSGHIHKNHGIRTVTDATESSRHWLDLCAPIMNRRGSPCQLPIVVDIVGL